MKPPKLEDWRTPEPNRGWFAVGNGVFFRRSIDGTVQCCITDNTEPIDGKDAVSFIGSTQWASIVASMSKQDETGVTYQQALDFHQKEPEG